MTLLLGRTGVIASSRHASGGGGGTGLDEADWLMTCVASDGAITETPGDINVRPYMSHYAALGLVRAYEITYHQPFLDAAKNWCLWYAAHMHPVTGYVNDYTEDGSGNRVDSGAADSTDAYAGMFGVVLLKTWYAIAGADTTWLDSVNAAAVGGNALLLATTAITSTQQEDGLTWALPTYTVKYLEDNLEAMAGLSALTALAQYTGNTAAADAAAPAVAAMSKGLGTLWNYQTRTYDYALHEDNVFTPNDWSDENSRRQQVWALAWGMNPPGAGDFGALFDAYVAALPGWYMQQDTYEVLPIWVLRREGRTSEADSAVAQLESVVASRGHAYPWTCATSGQLLMAKYDLGALSYAYADFPSGVNLMPNPDFADDSNADGTADGVSNYGNPTMALLPDNPSPSNIQQMIDPGGFDMHWDPIDVTPGHFYVLSCYRKITALDPGNLGVLTFKRYTADGTYIDYGYAPTVPDALDSDFVRWFVVIWADDTVGKIQPVIGGGNPGAITIEVKAIKLEQAGCSPTPFIYPAHLSVVDHYDDLSVQIGTPTGSLVWDNTGFTAASEIGVTIGYDGWLWFSPTDNCTATFDTFGSGPQLGGGNTDTHLRIYQNLDTQQLGIGGLLLLAESDDDNNQHSASPSDGANAWLQVQLQAGVLYYVQVGAHSTGHQPSTHMVLHWSGIEFTSVGDYPMRNDLLIGIFGSQAKTINGSGRDAPFSNWDYTTESFETGFHMFRSAWYTFVPDGTGTAVLDTSLVGLTGHVLVADGSSSQTDTYLRLYTGPDSVTSGSQLVQVAADDDSGGPGGQSKITTTVTGGQRYYVQASMYRDNLWNDRFALRWALPVPPPAPPTSVASGQDIVFDVATTGLTEYVLEFDMHPSPGGANDGNSVLEWARSADGSTRHAYWMSNNNESTDSQHHFHPAEDWSYTLYGLNTTRHVKLTYRPTLGVMYLVADTRTAISAGANDIDTQPGATRIRFAPTGGVTFTNITLAAV